MKLMDLTYSGGVDMKEVINKRIEELEKKIEKVRDKVRKETAKEYFDARKVIDLCVEVENLKSSLNDLYLVKGRAVSVQE